jgi:hypothetical protein
VGFKLTRGLDLLQSALKICEKDVGGVAWCTGRVGYELLLLENHGPRGIREKKHSKFRPG